MEWTSKAFRRPHRRAQKTEDLKKRLLLHTTHKIFRITGSHLTPTKQASKQPTNMKFSVAALFLSTLAVGNAGFLKGNRRLSSSSSSSSSSDDHGAGCEFEIFLSSANLTPPFIQEPVGAGGEAEVELQISSTGDYQVCLESTIAGFTPAIVHIHKGDSASIGPVVAGFGAFLVGQTVDGCTTLTVRDSVPDVAATFADICANPEGYYINMHAGPASERDDPNADYYRGARANLA